MLDMNDDWDGDHLAAAPDEVPMACLGLPLDYSTAAFGAPVEVLVIAKVIHGGDFAYRLLSTAELNSVEAMGMLRWGQLLVEDGIINRAMHEGDEEE